MNRLRLAALPLVLAASSALADIIVEERPLTAPPAKPIVFSGNTTVLAASETPATVSAPAPAAATTDSGSAAWQQYTQVEQLQQQLQQLQGLLEQQGFLIEKLQNDLRLRYTDLDQRLAGLQEQLQQQQQAAAAAASTPAPAAGTATPPSTTLEEEKRAYLAAYDTFRVGGPDKAIPPMLAFVKRYPNSSFVPGAYYWLGEFYLNASVPDQAAAQKQFDIVLMNYPNSPKAPAALYKTGAILDLQGKPQDARKRMQELLQKYPQSAEAGLAQSYLDALDSATKAAATEKKPQADKPAAGKAGPGKAEAKAGKGGKTPAQQTSSRKKN